MAQLAVYFSDPADLHTHYTGRDAICVPSSGQTQKVSIIL